MSNQSYNFKDINFLIKSAIVASVYVVLTVMLPVLSYGPIQLRLSEILVLLVFYNRRFIPGLVLGCFIANFFSPLAIFDVIFGSLASILAFYFMIRQNNLYKASIFPVLSMIFPAFATYMVLDNSYSFFIVLLQFIISEFVVVCIIGVTIFKIIEKKKSLMNYILKY